MHLPARWGIRSKPKTMFLHLDLRPKYNLNLAQNPVFRIKLVSDSQEFGLSERESNPLLFWQQDLQAELMDEIMDQYTASKLTRILFQHSIICTVQQSAIF